MQDRRLRRVLCSLWSEVGHDKETKTMTLLHANISVTLRDQVGREDSYQNCRSVYETDDAEQLKVEYKPYPNRDRTVVETYDAKEWRVVEISHTEDPLC